ncbi:hypothetical protein D3C71_1565350 [compost metagenome]
MVRQRGQQIERAAGLGLGQFFAELFGEGLPRLVAFLAGGHLLALGHEVGAGGEQGVPHVVVVAAGELGLGHATRRAAHGADAGAFPSGARGAKADDAKGHGGGLQ